MFVHYSLQIGKEMDKYQLLLGRPLGSGTFGDVFAAIHKPTGEVVAIKQLKRMYGGSAVEPEFQCYCESGLKHPNIVDFREFFMMNESDMNFVFEFMEGTLLDVMRNRATMFTDKEVRNMCFQILKGLDYMHKKGYFHRDLKPANLLVKQGVVKIGDLGSARKIDSCEPLEPYVTTRSYRAPEVMLRSGGYGPKVDMWAIGVIMAELFNLSPLFLHVNGLHPIARICSVIGTPTSQLRFPMLYRQHLSSLIPSASASAVSLIASLLSWDPCRRPTAEEALRHPFFDSCRIPPPIAIRPAQHVARNNWNLPPRLQRALLV